MQDSELLASIPDFVSFDTMMKASPVEEGGERFIYVEASKESRDQQGEIVLAKALKDSVDVFRKFGVVDMDHKSMPSVAKMYGITDPESWIIGQPAEVRFNGDVTFVKAQLRRGDTPLAERANRVWDGLTKVSPPDRYYASVGGSVLGREVRIDPVTKERVPVITKTRWNNLALSLNPVNPDLNPATTTPVGTFAKSLGGFVVAKALTAGYATDSAAMTGGQALATQSLDRRPKSYFDARHKISAAMTSGKLKNAGMNEIIAYAQKEFGMSLDESAEFCERFLRDIHDNLKRRKP